MLQMLQERMQPCMHALHDPAACGDVKSFQPTLYGLDIARALSCVTQSIPAVAPRRLCWLGLLLDMPYQQALQLRHLQLHQRCFLGPQHLGQGFLQLQKLARLCHALH